MDLGELVGSLRLEDSQFGQVLSSALDKLSGFGSGGAKLAGVAGATIALALGTSIAQNLTIDEANDRMAAELGASSEESARYGKLAGDLYAQNYGESMGAVNEAIAAVVSSIGGMHDASDEALSDVTAKAINFADVFEVDIARATQVAGQLISTGLAGDAVEAFDLMTAASQRVPAALREDILDAADEYGQFFSTLGYSGQEAFGLLVANAEKGMYGIDKAGDAIKEFTIRATDMSSASQDAYEAIGLDAEEMSNKILAGGATAREGTQQIIDGLLGIEDPATRANTAIALFGTPIEDLNTTEIPAFLESLRGGGEAMDGFSGAADRMDKTLNDNASSTLSKWKRQAEQAFLGLGNWAIPMIDETARAVDEWLQPLGGGAAAATVLAGVIGTVLVPAIIVWGIQSTIAGVKAAAAWTMAQLGAIRAAAGHVVSVAIIVGGWIAMGAAAMAQAARMGAAWLLGVVTGAARATASMAITVAAVVAGWVLMGVQAMAQAARMAAAWLIALGPIGIVIAAIAGVVILVIKYWDDIVAGTKAAWNWVVEQVKKVPGLIVGFFMNWTLPGLIIKHWDRISGAFSAGVNAAVGFVRSLPGRALDALGNLGGLLVGVGEDIMNGLLRGIERGFEWVRSKLGSVGKLIPGWLKDVLGISSPSKVMRDQVGLWIPAGVAEGVEAGARRFLHPALDRMAESVSRPITATAAYDASVAGLVSAGNRVDMRASSSGPWGDLADGARGPLVEQHIHPAPGMDEETIGDVAGERITFALETAGMGTS
ncbi:phage tail tape measure protein [uncultured Aeromicrobium sp.]|uniref:phage tail tape measure protein n=1 Tax=uncultured Aeromicrobium sp. TaxID=337820 RepID=UPI0025D53483|nr:phage tail tape measure protein [uncultured Aeromicrobium sp.]